MLEIIITITIDKDKIAATQLETTDMDKDQTVTIIDINQTITTEIIEKNSSNREQCNRYNSRDRNNDRNKNHKQNRMNNVDQQTNIDDPPGIDEYEYTLEFSNKDQEILDKFYNANEDTCNTIINTLESNPTWILPMYQYSKLEQDFTKQKPILEIDFLLDSGATLKVINEDTWNEIKYNNPGIYIEKANKTLTADKLEQSAQLQST